MNCVQRAGNVERHCGPQLPGSTNDLIFDIGHLIISDVRIAQSEWDSLAIVATVLPYEMGMTGYRYSGSLWEATGTRENSEALFERLQELQEAMSAENGNRWKQALIHITRPGPEFDIQFEYDDPKRWSPKKVGLDLADYAESLRPPRASS